MPNDNLCKTDGGSVSFGRGDAAMYEQFMDFINLVFGFNGASRSFTKLLPKLYLPCRRPCENNYVALEDGKIRGAVGAFDVNFNIAGEKIRGRGIGNVAVHPGCRSRGFMKRLMEDAVDDMVRDGVDISFLGGRRQRYNYFSYEKCGAQHGFSVVADNIRHFRGGSLRDDIVITKMTRPDPAALARVAEISNQRIYRADRPAGEDLFELLCSWESALYTAAAGGNVVGYAVVKGESVKEIALGADSGVGIVDFTAALYGALGVSALSVLIADCERGYIGDMCAFAETHTVQHAACFSVLNYERVIRAALGVRAGYADAYMPEGSLVLEINGRGGTERLKITVAGGAAGVAACADAPDAVLGHLDAMNILFAHTCPGRARLPGFARAWLPLPVYIDSADNV